MRTSFIIAAIVATPVMCLTACGADTPVKPVKGTVKEIEYEPAKVKASKKPITVHTCTTPRARKTGKKTYTPKPTCTTKSTGRYATAKATVKAACYEIEIRLADGSERDICDEAAYHVLMPGDRYSSTANYHGRKWVR